MNKVIKSFLVSATALIAMSAGLSSAFAGNVNPELVIKPNYSNYALTVNKVAGKTNTWSFSINGNLPQNACYKAYSYATTDEIANGTVIRLVLIKVDKNCDTVIPVGKEFVANAGSKVDFRVIVFDRNTSEAVSPLVVGTKYIDVNNGFKVVAVYNKDHQWDVQLTGKYSSCYNVDIKMGSVAYGIAGVHGSKGGIQRYFDGEFYVDMTPKDPKASLVDCNVKDANVDVKKTVKLSLLPGAGLRTREREWQVGDLSDGLKLVNKWLWQ